MRNIISIILLIGLLMPTVLAQEIQSDSFSANLIEIDKTIFPGQTATYELTINNFLDEEVRFEASVVDPSYIISSEPGLGNPMIGEETYILNVQPSIGSAYGPKFFDLKLSNIDTGEKLTFSVPITVQNPDNEYGEYVASVLIDIDMARDIDPREGITATIDLTNRNGRNLDPVKVYVVAKDESGELLIDQSFQAIIGPWKQKSQELRWNLDPLEKAGNYKLRVEVEFNGKIIQDKEKTFVILGYDEVSKEEKNSFRLLDLVSEVTVRNDGNQVLNYNISKGINWFSRIFLSASDDFEVVSEEGRNAIIPVELAPEESITVKYVVHWNYLAIIILAIIFGLIGYYKLRNPVISIKELLLEHTGKDNISEVKIRLFVRNRSNKVLNNIRIMDKVPPIADVMKADRLGTLQPSKINSTKSKGTIIRWELNSLEPYEERIITYKIKSKLEIVGGLSMPPAKIVFEEKQGKERQAYSSVAKL